MSDHPTLPFDEAEQAEEWRPVVGFEGLYEVSDRGRVWSDVRTGNGKRGGFLTPAWSGRKAYPNNIYLTVGLYRDRKRYRRSVHRLVAEAFLGLRPAGLVVRHGPGGQADNSLGNLSYGTYSENAMDQHRDGTIRIGEAQTGAKLTEEAVRDIRRRHAAGEGYRPIARSYGVAPNAIWLVVKRKRWAHVA